MGYKRRWRFQDGHLLGMSCWSMSPSRWPDGKSGVSTWTQRPSGRILGRVQWAAIRSDGRHQILFLFTIGGKECSRVVMMQPDGIAGGPRVRWWWTCPGCGRRCGKVFIIPPDGLMLCRFCGSVTYTSQQQQHLKRSMASLGIHKPPGLRRADLRSDRISRKYRRPDRQEKELARLMAADRLLWG